MAERTSSVNAQAALDVDNYRYGRMAMNWKTQVEQDGYGIIEGVFSPTKMKDVAVTIDQLKI